MSNSVKKKEKNIDEFMIILFVYMSLFELLEHSNDGNIKESKY